MYSTDEINSSRIDRMDSTARPNERTALFPYRCGGRLSSDSVQYLVSKYFVVVQQTCRTQTRNAARTSTQRRDRAVTSRQRPGGHCTLARTRVRRTTQIYLDADLARTSEGTAIEGPRRTPDLLEEPVLHADYAALQAGMAETTSFTRRKHSA